MHSVVLRGSIVRHAGIYPSGRWFSMTEPTVITTEPITVAFLTMHGAYTQTPEGYGRLYAWIGQHGFQPVGMPAAVFLTMPPDTPEADAVWELWAPVAEVPEVPQGEDGIGIKRIGATMAVSAMHTGPYDTVGPVYEELWRWVAANGYVPDGPPLERYFSDPAEVPPEEYLTEVVMPVRRA
jgi:AraC family transcriptional regulator